MSAPNFDRCPVCSTFHALGPYCPTPVAETAGEGRVSISLNEITRLWPGCDAERVKQQLQRLDTRPAEALTKEALDTFMSLGRPSGLYAAFHDMDPDDVLFENSGVVFTVGTVRQLQRLFRAMGVIPQDRLSALMRGLPTGSAQ